MRLLLTLLLLSISAVTCDIIFPLDTHTGMCQEMCPYFKKKSPNKKIADKEINQECKKGQKELKKSCAIMNKLSKEDKRNMMKVNIFFL
ncbi:unnamed protein product [Cylicocyclus nassatus]|uniref:Uncharacterized protein n=1 Tax=Cylicocyclus nassatus TaxID=53992 RepID=A0AA36HBA1_CYLNA|nr:unnamed protein product [Cylicocyclus nassatus]